MEKPTRRPWWSHLRFGLRTLIVLVLLIGGILGWTVHQAQVQREAVAAVLRAGGRVRYNWEVPAKAKPTFWGGMDGGGMGGGLTGQPVANSKPPWPRWLVDRMGLDYFGHVVEVDLFGHGSDADLESIGRLRRLERLVLARSAVTDLGLAHLKELTELQGLYLGATRVSNAGLAHLKGLTRLRGLGLDGTRVSDTGLAPLEGMTSLQQLVLEGTEVSDAGLVHLKGMTELRILSLGGTRVTANAAQELQELLPKASISR
jgi:internalin A